MRPPSPCACLAVLAALVPCAAPAGQTGGPLDQIRQTTDQILAILKDPALKGDDHREPRRQKIRDAVDQRFDWTAMAQSSLAVHWRKRTPEERKTFVALYTELVRRTYMGKVEGYAGEKVVYQGQRVKGNYARVDVQILTTKNTEIPVVYSMKHSGERWLVYDVTIEGVRLVNNYRTQFRTMLDRMTYAEFVEELKAKVAKMKDDD